MTKISREYLKRLVAEHRLDDLIEELFQLLTNFLSQKKDRSVSEIYDSLILISGKLKSIRHENLLGIIDSKDSTLESNKIGYSLISVINGIPESVFENQSNSQKKIETTREKIKKINSTTPFTYDIFLSFSSKNVSEAKTLAEGLRGYGLRVFISDEVLKSNVGTSFFEKIDFALNNSKDFILIATPASMESEWVKTEYETFYNECYIPNKIGRKFIVFKGADFESTTIPSLLKRLQFADTITELLDSYIEQAELERKAIEEKHQKEQEELERKAIEEKRLKEQADLEAKAIGEKHQKEQAELKRKAIEEKRLKEQADLEAKAIGEKHQKEQAELERKAVEEKRQKEQAELERKAIEEKRQKEQAELERKAVEEKRQKEQAELERKAIEEKRQKEQAELERKAVEEKRQKEQAELERKAVEEKRQKEQAELERKAVEEKRQKEQAELERKAVEEKRQKEQAELERKAIPMKQYDKKNNLFSRFTELTTPKKVVIIIVFFGLSICFSVFVKYHYLKNEYIKNAQIEYNKKLTILDNSFKIAKTKNEFEDILKGFSELYERIAKNGDTLFLDTKILKNHRIACEQKINSFSNNGAIETDKDIPKVEILSSDKKTMIEIQDLKKRINGAWSLTNNIASSKGLGDIEFDKAHIYFDYDFPSETNSGDGLYQIYTKNGKNYIKIHVIKIFLEDEWKSDYHIKEGIDYIFELSLIGTQQLVLKRQGVTYTYKKTNK